MKIKYLDIAKQESLKSLYKHKIGAIIVYKNRILSKGYNNPYKTNPRSNTLYKTLHAEFNALIKAPLNKLKGSDMYIYNHRKSNTPGCSKPCLYCLALIKKCGIKNVYFTTGNNKYWESIKL